MPTYEAPPSVFEAPSIDPPETIVVMLISFISQDIDISICAIIDQVSRELADIFKLKVHNEVQQDKKLETKQTYYGDNYITYTPWGV